MKATLGTDIVQPNIVLRSKWVKQSRRVSARLNTRRSGKRFGSRASIQRAATLDSSMQSHQGVVRAIRVLTFRLLQVIAR